MAWPLQHLPHNPASELQLPCEEKRLPRHALRVEEIERVLDLPDIHKPLGPRDRTLMEVFYSTGLRRWELARLELTDIDRQRGTILVRCLSRYVCLLNRNLSATPSA